MGNWEFYDDCDETEGIEEQDPSFSIYDFKKWLETKHPNEASLLEDTSPKEQLNPEEIKEKFKKQVCDRVNKNIENKMKQRKKK